MNDIERLEQWMKAKNMTVWDLGREMQLPRHTVYFVVVKRKHITQAFAKKFLQQYGWDVASNIFVDHYANLLEFVGTPS